MERSHIILGLQSTSPLDLITVELYITVDALYRRRPDAVIDLNCTKQTWSALLWLEQSSSMNILPMFQCSAYRCRRFQLVVWIPQLSAEGRSFTLHQASSVCSHWFVSTF